MAACIFREANFAADKLASVGVSVSNPHFWDYFHHTNKNGQENQGPSCQTIVLTLLCIFYYANQLAYKDVKT